MIDRSHALPIRRQADELGLCRSTVYYRPRPVPAADLAIMRRIDELHLDYPFAGARMLRDLLNGEGIAIGRDRVVGMMTDGDRSDLSPAEHVQAGARP
jgi:putative transposase